MNRSSEGSWRQRSMRLVAVVALVAVTLGLSGCNKLKARDRLNKGVQAYKSAKYEEAINRFKEAAELDPELMVAKLYLATAYAQQYVPGIDSPDNNRMAEAAIAEYQKVVDANPDQEQKVTGLKGIASLYFGQKKFDQAKEYHRKVLEVDPNDPETYYSIAVIDWTQTYTPRMEERAKIGLKPDEPLKDKKVCQMLRDKNLQTVQEGIDMLTKAIELRQDYDDAMAYLNLLYRERADIQCDDPEARAADLKQADEWVEKTMATKKAKAEKQAQHGGIVLDQSGQQQQ